MLKEALNRYENEIEKKKSGNAAIVKEHFKRIEQDNKKACDQAQLRKDKAGHFSQ